MHTTDLYHCKTRCESPSCRVLYHIGRNLTFGLRIHHETARKPIEWDTPSAYEQINIDLRKVIIIIDIWSGTICNRFE
jgi:hypothetical protein